MASSSTKVGQLKANSGLLQLAVYICYVAICFGYLCDQRNNGGELTCCRGKNDSCYVIKEYVEVPLTNIRPQPDICYCDEHCDFAKDCCSDFKEIEKECKGAIDCKMGGWGEWSECSKKCGFGTKERHRSVTVEEKNGGKPCPSKVQYKGCILPNQQFCKQIKYEPALILPINYRRPTFGKWKYERILPAVDEESNYLPNYRYIHEQNQTYCYHYRLLTQRNQCAGTWAEGLSLHSTICMECQPQAMRGFKGCRGEGQSDIMSRWKALRVPRCHGDWVRLGDRIPNCKCDQKNFSNFVFV